MSETAPAAPAAAPAAEKASVKKKAPKKAAGVRRKASGPPVSELITRAVGASKERSGVSLAALKKSLAAAGYDVEKNNSRIKLGLKSLVNKGILVQTKGTGASGSFKLNKKAGSGEVKPKVKKTGAAKAKKPAAAKKVKKAAGAATPKKSAKKTPKKAKKPAAAAGVKKVAKSPKKVKAAKTKKAAKSPAKAVKAKAAKPRVTKPKKAAPKKK
ncbi:histone H1.2 [Echinops telfairi]|uniref:Histone H1.2 n=1 Tax=Echinops telfairi TaxID=9371 RepID=A0ABM0J158_ECHTE|nr:histone H1.2 [Echinops telfairi]